MNTRINLAIFISGQGSNARNLIRHFHEHALVNVSMVISSRSNDEMKGFSEQWGLQYVEIAPWDEALVFPMLEEANIHAMVLAGFLRKITPALISRFPDKIINIHPSLLPKYGGKGMYGRFVHEAVFLANEKETGITVYFVNEAYDDGQVLLQASCAIAPEDSIEDIEEKVKQLEQRFFPEAVSRFCAVLQGRG